MGTIQIFLSVEFKCTNKLLKCIKFLTVSQVAVPKQLFVYLFCCWYAIKLGSIPLIIKKCMIIIIKKYTIQLAFGSRHWGIAKYLDRICPTKLQILFLFSVAEVKYDVRYFVIRQPMRKKCVKPSLFAHALCHWLCSMHLIFLFSSYSENFLLILT